MKRLAIVLLGCGLLAACGVDGDPVKPEVSGSTSFGVNSKSGVSTSTTIGIHFPAN